ncbi:MAG: PorT family protein [Bacteroidetes bacterium]|nr:PorT family protein [Bacteroidota bacterium]MBS1736798.1 PorT family protein [Bacteroidota bacterium]
MKKSIFHLMSFIIITNSIESSAQLKPSIKFGLKGGFNASLMKGKNFYSEHFEGYNGFHAGALIEASFGKHFAIQPEGIYSTTGYQWAGYYPNYYSISHWDTRFIERLSFISLPVLLKFKTSGLGIFAGPQWDFPIYSKRFYLSHAITSSGEVIGYSDVKNDYKSTLSVSFVGGIEYSLKSGIGFQARYQYGNVNIAQATQTGIYDETSALKNNMVSLGAFIKFGKPVKSIKNNHKINKERKNYFGAKLGFNTSNVYVDNVYDNTDKPFGKAGFMAGIFYEHFLGKHFSIQPELFYANAGFIYIQVYSPFMGEPGGTTSLNYASLPLLLKLRLKGVGIFAGPQLNVLVTAKDKREGYSEHQRIKEQHNSTNYALTGGIEYTFPFGLGFGVRYQKGMSNIAKQGNGIYLEETVHLNAIQGGVHFRF